MQAVGIKFLLLDLEKWEDEIRKHEEGTAAAMLNEATKKSVGSGASIIAENIRSFELEFSVRVFSRVNSRLVTTQSSLPFSDFLNLADRDLTEYPTTLTLTLS